MGIRFAMTPLEDPSPFEPVPRRIEDVGTSTRSFFDAQIPMSVGESMTLAGCLRSSFSFTSKEQQSAPSR